MLVSNSKAHLTYHFGNLPLTTCFYFFSPHLSSTQREQCTLWQVQYKVLALQSDSPPVQNLTLPVHWLCDSRQVASLLCFEAFPSGNGNNKSIERIK